MHLLALQSRHENEYLNIHSFRPLAADLEPLFRDPDVTNFTPRRPDPDAPLPRRPAAPTPRLRPYASGAIDARECPGASCLPPTPAVRCR